MGRWRPKWHIVDGPLVACCYVLVGFVAGSTGDCQIIYFHVILRVFCFKRNSSLLVQSKTKNNNLSWCPVMTPITQADGSLYCLLNLGYSGSNFPHVPWQHYIRPALVFDLILYVPPTIFQSCRDRSSSVEPVLLS